MKMNFIFHKKIRQDKMYIFLIKETMFFKEYYLSIETDQELITSENGATLLFFNRNNWISFDKIISKNNINSDKLKYIVDDIINFAQNMDEKETGTFEILFKRGIVIHYSITNFGGER